MSQVTRYNVSKAYLLSRMQYERVRFLRSCVSEGLIPRGLRSKFNLAGSVNNFELVRILENLLSKQSSKQLDLVYLHSQKELAKLENQYDDKKEILSTEVTQTDFKHIVIQIKRENHHDINHKYLNLRRKLGALRLEKAAGQSELLPSQGSRNIYGSTYFKAEDTGEARGAPFPKNLRPHRINRPHKNRNPYAEQFVSSPEEDSQRDPILLTTNPNFRLSEAGRKLMALGPKTAPTPRGPVDEKSQYEAWVKWRESLRWSWFFNKHQKPEDISHDHVSQPWDEKTQRSAPVAHDCPDLEAFMEAIHRDLIDPSKRKKIKDNLSSDQRNFIKEVRNEFPQMNLRIRMEDKGKRFVIVDGDNEDNQIEESLSNPVHYREVDESPLTEHSQRLEELASRGLERQEITAEMYRFITNQQPNTSSSQEAEEPHLANPQPKMKTHKLDDQGNMVDPVPIRVITVGTGTPIQNLSKLCSKSIEHLTTPENLPRHNRSTKEVVKRIFFINDQYTPLPPDSAIALCDVKSMYPNTDVAEGIAEIKSRLETDPSPIGLSADYLAECLKLCMECNCVQFKDKFYIPCRGCAQGPCHACDFTDIWMGTVVKKHVETSNIDSILFSIYRDDSLDILKNGKVDEPALRQEMDSLHPNLTWDIQVEK